MTFFSLSDERPNRASEMGIQAQVLHPCRMADVMEQRIKEGNRQVLVSIVYLEDGIVLRLLVPEYPCGKESVEN